MDKVNFVRDAFSEINFAAIVQSGNNTYLYPLTPSSIQWVNKVIVSDTKSAIDDIKQQIPDGMFVSEQKSLTKQKEIAIKTLMGCINNVDDAFFQKANKLISSKSVLTESVKLTNTDGIKVSNIKLSLFDNKNKQNVIFFKASSMRSRAVVSSAISEAKKSRFKFINGASKFTSSDISVSPFRNAGISSGMERRVGNRIMFSESVKGFHRLNRRSNTISTKTYETQSSSNYLSRINAVVKSKSRRFI